MKLNTMYHSFREVNKLLSGFALANQAIERVYFGESMRNLDIIGITCFSK